MIQVPRYIDPNDVHFPLPGRVPPAAWGTTVRENLELLVSAPTCSVFNRDPQTIPSQSVPADPDEPGTALIAPQEHIDTVGMHNTLTDNSKVFVLVNGFYELYATVTLPTVATFDESVVAVTAFRVDDPTGVALLGGDIRSLQPTSAGEPARASFMRTRSMQQGAFVEVFCAHNVGVDADVVLEEFAVVFRARQ